MRWLLKIVLFLASPAWFVPFMLFGILQELWEDISNWVDTKWRY